MKNIMRAISLGLVCAIATSNVAQAGIFSTFKNAYEKTKDVACKYGSTLMGVPAVGFLFAATYRMGRVNGALKVSDHLLSRTEPKLHNMWDAFFLSKYETGLASSEVGSKMRSDLIDALKEVHLANKENQRVEDYRRLRTVLIAGAGFGAAYLLEKERIKDEERKSINLKKA